MSKIIENARKLRAAVIKATAGLDDKIASTIPDLYPRMTYNGELISAGTRINWNGSIKRAAVDLWDREENNPNLAPTLWEDIEYRDGFRIIPTTITAGTAFASGELGWWNGVLYRSTLDNNVWTPEAYPAGWEVVDN